MLGLVAPITMTADQCTIWLASAEDALADIRANEVAEISMEVRRTVTRPSQIVPEIAKLISERRKSKAQIRRLREEDEAARTLPPPRKHVSERDRSKFTAADWAELNEYLERMGSSVRYGSDGSPISPTGGR